MDNIIKYIYEYGGSLRDLIDFPDRKDLEKDMALNELEDSLIKQLSKEQRELYEHVVALHFAINDEYVSEAFSTGFKIGSRITYEVFNGKLFDIQ